MGTAPAGATYFTVKLKSREAVAEGTMAFRFEKPANWTFKAGQALDMTLLNPSETDAQGNTRAFSLASAPQEDLLMIATRMRDTAFKRALRALPIGAEVKIEGPFGDLTLHNKSSRAAVLLAGGIGITPFRSIIVRAAREKLPHRIFLFYGNRRPEDAAFLEELRAIEKENPNYKLIAAMSEIEKSKTPWQGETGFIGKAMLSKYVTGAASPIYYVAGPPAMVKAMRDLLNRASVDDDDIRAEEFSGY